MAETLLPFKTNYLFWMHFNRNIPRWTFTSRFTAKKGQGKFLRRLNEVRNLFPELEDHTVKVGITLRVDGKADLESKAIYFRSRNASCYTLAHELTHLLQGMEKVPGGERSCDLYTLARHVNFCDQAPNYLKMPQKLLDENGLILEKYRILVHDTAKAALQTRTYGKKNYITWFEKVLEDLFIQTSSTFLIEEKSKDISVQMRLDSF
jgi:hypothetical protein